MHTPTRLRTTSAPLRPSFSTSRHLTRRRQAGATRSRTDERFSKAFLANPAALAIITREDGCFLEANDSFLKIVGYSREAVLGRQEASLGIMEDSGWHTRLGSGLSGPASDRELELTVITRQGERRTLHLTVESIDLNGRPCLLCFFQDVTEQKKARLELLEANSRYRALMNNAPARVYVKDLEGRFSLVNHRLAEMLNVAPESAIGSRPEDLLSSGRVEDFLRNDQEVLASRAPIEFEESALEADGPHSYFTIKFPMMHPDGTIYGIGGISSDISIRKRAEQILSETARHDRAYGDALSIISSTLDKNSLLIDILGLLAIDHGLPVSAYYAYEEEHGTLLQEATWGTPTGLPARFPMGEGLVGHAAKSGHMLQIFPGDPGEYDLPVSLVAPPTVVLLAIPVRYLHRNLGVLVVASPRPLEERDCIFLERLCIQLGATLHNLKQYADLKLLTEQLRGRNEEIARMNRQLREANRVKSEFMATMTHELRTPLNAIIGFSELLQGGMVGELESRPSQFAGHILSSGKHLLSLIDEILDLTKIEAGMMRLELESTRLPCLISACLTIIKERAASHCIELELKLIEPLPPIMVDVRRFKQILYNLLSNAVKFTPRHGKITVSARMIDPHSRPETSTPEGKSIIGEEGASRCPTCDDRRLELSVADTGIGIAAKDLGRLFTPFVQLDSDLNRKYEGTGLGLVLVKHLAELHGGSVTLTSTPGQGSCFTVLLPYRYRTADRQDDPDRCMPNPEGRYSGLELHDLHLEPPAHYDLRR